MTSPEHAIAPDELMAYLDGELEPARAREVLAHVASCEQCRHLADEIRGVSHRLSEWTVDPAPAQLRTPSIPAPSAGAKAPVWRRWPALGLAAAAVMILIAANVGIFSRHKRVPVRAAAPVTLEVQLPPGRGVGGNSVAAGQPAVYQTGEVADAARQVTGPVIARTARLQLLARDFEAARAALERIAREASGFVGDLSVGGGQGARRLHATLRVPVPALGSALGALRQIGQVLEESQNADDLTEQWTDIDVRLANGRRTERRLVELLGNRTGKLSDVLDVERELARVRTEIEGLETQRKTLDRRVAYATVRIEISEEPKASVTLGPTPITTRLRNAAVDGARTALDSVLEVVLFAVEIGPTLLLWAVLLFWPARVLARRFGRKVRAVGHAR